MNEYYEFITALGERLKGLRDPWLTTRGENGRR